MNFKDMSFEELIKHLYDDTKKDIIATKEFQDSFKEKFTAAITNSINFFFDIAQAMKKAGPELELINHVASESFPWLDPYTEKLSTILETTQEVFDLLQQHRVIGKNN